MGRKKAVNPRQHRVATSLTTSEMIAYRRALALIQESSSEFLRRAIQLRVEQGGFPQDVLGAPPTEEEMRALFDTKPQPPSSTNFGPQL